MRRDDKSKQIVRNSVSAFNRGKLAERCGLFAPDAVTRGAPRRGQSGITLE